MPRSPRRYREHTAQHVIQRGINRSPTFIEYQDYHLYLKYLAAYAGQCECRIHAYVLMTNHVHLLTTPSSRFALSELMQNLGRRYVRYFNDRHDRTGALWEGRYRASLVDSDSYLITCMQYIEMNPVRARMVDHPREYQWSSFSTNAGGRIEEFISPHPTYLSLSDDPLKRMATYERGCIGGIDDEVLRVIRKSGNSNKPLGLPAFRDRVDKTRSE